LIPRSEDGVHRAQPHRHRRELPEVGHQPGVRVGRQPAARVAVFLAEAVELVGAESPFQERAGVDPRRRVTLDEDLVAATGRGLAAEEVVEAHLVERRRGCIGGDVPAHADPRALGAVHHDRGVPADPAPIAPLDVLVAGEPGLQFGGDGVDVIRRGQSRDGYPLFTCALEQAQHQVAGPGRPGAGQQIVERLEPLRGFVGVDIGQVRRDALPDHPDPVGFDRAARTLGLVIARELGRHFRSSWAGAGWGSVRVLSCRTRGAHDAECPRGPGNSRGAHGPLPNR
jgi:hypothetical protein